MVHFQTKRNKLVGMYYRPDNSDVQYDMSWVLDTPFAKTFETLANQKDSEAATAFWKLAYSIARADTWKRVGVGAWTVEYAGHLVLCENDPETGTVSSRVLRENPNATLPAWSIADAAVLAYYYRRHKHTQRAAETSKRQQKLRRR